MPSICSVMTILSLPTLWADLISMVVSKDRDIDNGYSFGLFLDDISFDSDVESLPSIDDVSSMKPVLKFIFLMIFLTGHFLCGLRWLRPCTNGRACRLRRPL